WLGASPDTLRVRLTERGDDVVSVAVADADGRPVAEVESLAWRTVRPERLAAGRPPGHPLGSGPAPAAGPAPAPAAAPPGVPALAGDPARATHATLEWLLDLVQRWLAEDRPDGARLVVRTRNAVGSGPRNPAMSAVWGFVRSLRAEHPGRFGLVDTDGEPASAELVPAALPDGEPELMVRGGVVSAPRLAPAEPAPEPAAS